MQEHIGVNGARSLDKDMMARLLIGPVKIDSELKNEAEEIFQKVYGHHREENPTLSELRTYGAEWGSHMAKTLHSLGLHALNLLHINYRRPE